MLVFTLVIPLGIAVSNDATSEEGIVIACPATSNIETGTPLTVPKGRVRICDSWAAEIGPNLWGPYFEVLSPVSSV
jgi:hypothetical protein